MNSLEQILMDISKDEIEEYLKEKAKNEKAKKKFANSLLDVYAVIENTEKRVADVVMTPELFSDFRKVFTDADFEHDKNKIFKGLMGSMWGHREMAFVRGKIGR